MAYKRKKQPHPERDYPFLSEAFGVRHLHFGSPWIQGAMNIRNPAQLVFIYAKDMFAYLPFVSDLDEQTHVTILGLGAGSFTRYLTSKAPKAQQTVVEWSTDVLMVCQHCFNLDPNDGTFEFVQADAHLWVNDPAQEGQADVLMVDLYDHTGEGPVCQSQAFYQGCANHLRDGGVMSVNLFKCHDSYQRNFDRIKKAFNGYVMEMPETEDGNCVVIAFKNPQERSKQDVLERARILKKHYRDLPLVRYTQYLLKQHPMDWLL